jgi:hypothetical protein
MAYPSLVRNFSAAGGTVARVADFDDRRAGGDPEDGVIDRAAVVHPRDE